MSETYKKLGKLLQLERQRQNIELADMATELKTTETYLECIETGDVASLPSKIYFNLFAKSYAEAIGIDYAATLEAINEDIEEPEESMESDDPDPKESTTSTHTTDRKKPPESTNQKPGSVIQVKKLAYLLGGVVVIFAVFLLINELFLNSTSKVVPETMTIDTTEESVSEQAAIIDSDTGLTSYNWDIHVYEEPSEITLQLRAVSESWAAVLADGDTVIFRTLVPYKTYEVTAKYRLQVSVGLPSVVDIILNDQPVNLPISSSGRISGVIINQLNLKDILSNKLNTAVIKRPSTRQVASRQTTETTPNTQTDTLQPSTTDTIQPSSQPNETLKSLEFNVEDLADSTIITEGQR